MSDFRSDFRDPDRRLEREAEFERRMGSASPWGWIAGAVFIFLVLALVFTSNTGPQTASNNPNPLATTGMGAPTTPPAMPAPPASQPSTTGQGR